MEKSPLARRANRSSDTEIEKRGRPRSFDREAALQVAVLCFWEFGYDTTTVRKLTARMGIKLPSLYAAFSNKPALFIEALDAYERTHMVFDMSAFDGASSLEDAINRHVKTHIKRIAAKGPWGCMLLGSTPSPTGVEDRKIVLRLRSRRESYEAHLRLALGRGWMEPNDAVPAAQDIFLLLVGLSARARDGVDRPSLKRMADRQSQWIARHYASSMVSKR